MRYCDDIADDPGIEHNKKAMLEKWRGSLDSISRGEYENSPILPAFLDAVTRFNIPLEYFHQLIDGAEMDLCKDGYASFGELYEYCYRVASVVGLVCIHVFGFDDPRAKEYAEYCGIAFQLTNILRDLKEDSSIGRVYLPQEDLWAFGYSEKDLEDEVFDERFMRLMNFEIMRAKCYYGAALSLLPLVHESGRPGLWAMISIYYSILRKIEHKNFDVFSEKVSLSKAQKISIAAKTMLTSRHNGGRLYLRGLR
jgi:phytoene synthase